MGGFGVTLRFGVTFYWGGPGVPQEFLGSNLGGEGLGVPWGFLGSHLGSF